MVGLLLPGIPSTAALLVTSRRHMSVQQLRQYSFGAFVREFERQYAPGSEEWTRREQQFNASLAEVVAFESGPPRSWKKGINKFMDYSPQEYKALLGYRGRGSRRSASGRGMSFFSRRNQREVNIPNSVLLGQTEGSLVNIVRDQGSCGSCWAEAAVAVLEGALEKNGTALNSLTLALHGKQKVATLSSQAMVSCTPNPRNCGGKGGCSGATVELGLDMVQKRGLPLAVQWNYESGTGFTPQCKDSVFSSARLGITGYKVLPSNKHAPLKQALYETGAPIAVSVDATGWTFYTEGIYSDGDGKRKGGGEFTVNHAVTLTGYQEPTEKDPNGFWKIKNSWGQYWGESGFIRLEMKFNEEEHCGWDYNTHDGLACDGDPDTAWVCGTCGVLYDSSYPTGVHFVSGEQQVI